MPRHEELPIKFQLAITEAMDAAINDWRRRHEDLPNRLEAIRRLIELGLHHAPHKPASGDIAIAEPASLWPMPTEVEQALDSGSPKAAAQASGMASKQIDKLGDTSATNEEQQSRKRRLLRGPKEFRDIREKALAEKPKRKR
jgi:hypothetical protein